MQIKKIILSQFKGITNAEFTFDGNTVISGQNGSGKTTVADAYFWLFTDKDYSLKSNPEIHPDFLEESEPSVEIVCDIDGKEVSFRKFQKDSRTKKQREAGAPVRISNQYEVNSVPKSQKDFDAALTEYGIDKDKFLLLTHPEIFTGMKSADCRKILFGMTNDVTDKSIADSMGNCQEVSALLDNYTAEEITALQKRTKKEADQNLDNIPQQIIGLEKAKVQIDVQSITADRDALQSEIDEVEKTIKENPLPDMGDLNQKIAMFENQKKALETDANTERREKLQTAREELAEIQRKRSDAEYEFQTAIGAEEERNGRIEQLKKDYQSLADTFQKVKAITFDESSNVCKYCGQPLPADKADENRNKFNAEIKRQKLDINRQAAAIKKQIKELESHPVSIPDHSAIDDLSKQEEQKKAEVESLSQPIDVTGSDEYKAIEFEIAKVRQAMDALDFAKKKREELESEVAEKRRQVNFMNDQIAKEDVNKHIDEQIAKAKEQQKQYAQVSANAEKILDQLSRISMKKNEMLTDQVNSHFSKVKFKLFEQLKNGEFRDTCIPTIDGKVLGESANTAREIEAKLDIISGLQDFYGQDLPVFLDNSESLDSQNSKIDIGHQLIMLRVTDDEKLIVS